ncbi:MAG: hypothetical protein K2H76_00345 [Muribaculaceae bacterium]|nr:hypothetical protein [Muribaculaceae bacterium]
MKLNLKVLTIAGCIVLTGTTVDAQLLNRLKEKATKAVSEIKGEKTSSNDTEKKKSNSSTSRNSSNGSSSSSGQKEWEISDMYCNGEQVPSILMNIPMSDNLHGKYDRDFPSEPKVAPGARAVYVDGTINYYFNW